MSNWKEKTFLGIRFRYKRESTPGPDHLQRDPQKAELYTAIKRRTRKWLVIGGIALLGGLITEVLRDGVLRDYFYWTSFAGFVIAGLALGSAHRKMRMLEEPYIAGLLGSNKRRSRLAVGLLTVGISGMMAMSALSDGTVGTVGRWLFGSMALISFVLIKVASLERDHLMSPPKEKKLPSVVPK